MVTVLRNRIIHGDTREVLKDYPENFFDCICSDIPYLIATGGVSGINKGIPTGGILLNREGLKESKDLKRKWLRQNENDDNVSFLQTGKLFKNVPKFTEWLPEVYRVAKESSHIYLMINGRNLSSLQVEAEKVGFKYMNTLVWIKNTKTPNKYFMQQAEFILMLRKGYAKNIKDMGKSNIFNCKNPTRNKYHPTEKPVELMRSLIEESASKGDVVLDMFCGSGSTLIACKELGIDYVGIEIEKEFVDIAKKRIENPFYPRKDEMSEQGNLFMKGGC